MNKICHVLKPNKAQKLPKWVIFFDTETKETTIDERSKRLTLKLGHAILTRRDKDNTFRTVDSLDFRSSAEFHGWLEDKLKGRERYYLTAHNIGFDIRVVGLLDYLASSQWERTFLIEEGLNFIARFRRGDTTLRILNNQQLFATSLRNLGKSIGLQKGDVSFATATDAELMSYCRNDVEVMRQAWNLWIRYIADNDLGNFQITAASQAFGAFRHRFMDTPIFIHNNDKATRLERESYHGGRVECFFIGTYDASNVYCLDVNSMYPHVMKENKYPVKLLKYHEQIKPEQFEIIRSRYSFIVEAELSLRQPCLPVISEARLSYPCGNLRGVFTKPELEYALQFGTLRRVHRIAVYDEAPIFSRFVDHFYSARQKFKAEGNTAFTYLTKIFMNSLYGKFGQKQMEYVKIGTTSEMKDGLYTMTWGKAGELGQVRVINGIMEKAVGYKEGFNSFVAIASYVTTYARIYLAELIERAGRENVLYCDTDSLFVNEVGYARLQGDIDGAALGKLKLEGVHESITIKAPKRYKFGEKIVNKGIRADALQLSPDTYVQDKFMSFRGSLRAQDSDGVIVSRVTKTLHYDYKKGVVLPSGFVMPLEL